MKCNSVYQFVERKIGGIFAKYGRFVAAHAWKILIVSFIVNGGLGLGMMKLELDNDASNYLPSGTQAEIDEERIEELFPYVDYENFDSLRLIYGGPWLRMIVRSKSGNLLTRQMLEELRSLTDTVQNITADTGYGHSITFADVCAKINQRCVMGGQLFVEDEFLAAVDMDYVTYPEFNISTRGMVYYASMLGGKVNLDDSGQYLKSVEYLRLEVMIPYWGRDKWLPKIPAYSHMSLTQGRYKITWNIVYVSAYDKKYFSRFIEKLEKFKATMDVHTSQHLDIAYGYFESVSEELENNLTGDITLFAGTMILMIIYAVIATLSSRLTDQVGQRIWLGLAGILAAVLAIVGSIGLCSLAGVTFVTIVGVVPFLIIGIGIDDMFILLSGLSEAQTQTTVENKMAETLRISGVGVTITSLTDLIAFMSGAGSSFPAVKNFCIYTGVAVLFCYLNNITFFAACVAINERRVAGNRHFITCRKIKDKDDLSEEGKPKRHVICCGGRAPANREEAESFVDKLPRWLIPKIVLSWPCKVIIVILFMQYIAAAVYGCVHLKQGMPFTQLVSDDSYFYKYSDWDEKYFARQTIVTFVIPNTYDYSEAGTQLMMDKLIANAHSNKYFDKSFEVSWLKSYKNSQYYNNTSRAAFKYGLQAFFNDTQYAVFLNDVVIDHNSISASRVYLRSTNLKNSQEEGKLMLQSRDIANSAAIDCFAYSPAFIVSELYVRILRVTLQSVGIALAAVFVITCIFMPHPILIAIVTVAVASIMAGVFGFMLYLDVSLSAISMLMLIMSIGFSVDFTAHICHGYMISDGETRALRVRQAIDKTGAPIFHGAVSSLLGILVLIGAKSYIFRSFAAVMSFVLLFGITHALFLLPVILSWFGPGRMKKVDRNSRLNNMTNIAYTVDDDEEKI